MYTGKDLHNLIYSMLLQMEKFFDNFIFRLDKIEIMLQSMDEDQRKELKQFLNSPNGKKSLELILKKAGHIYNQYGEIANKLKSILSRR